MKAYSVIWIAVSAAVIAGIFITHSANCLWTFLIPALISYTEKSSSSNSNKDESEITENN